MTNQPIFSLAGFVSKLKIAQAKAKLARESCRHALDNRQLSEKMENALLDAVWLGFHFHARKITKEDLQRQVSALRDLTLDAIKDYIKV